ncbi:MAG: PepSY domain-containing protein [Cellvibrionaceae bacterium]
MTKLSSSIILAATLVFAASTFAREIGHNEVRELRRKGELLAFEHIILVLFERHPESQVIEVELELKEARGVFVYEIEILTTENQIREVEIDARTGEVLGDKLED